MSDNIRVSDADRERVAERLREHYAEGRLTADELDERITATLNAKTFADLRPILADLPGPAPVPPPDLQPAPRSRRPVVVYHRGPRLFPLVLLALVAAVVLPGAGFVFLTFLKIMLALCVVVCVAGIIAAARFRRHARRYFESGLGNQWRYHEWRR